MSLSAIKKRGEVIYIIGFVFFILYMLSIGAIINQIAQLGIAIKMARIHNLQKHEADTLEEGVMNGTIKEVSGSFAMIRLIISYASVLLLGLLFYLSFNLVITIIACIAMFIQVSIFHTRSIEGKMIILREVVETGNEDLFKKSFSIQPLLFGLIVFTLVLTSEIVIFNILV